jgi:hypothetical protein
MNKDTYRYGRTPYAKVQELLNDHKNKLPEICYSASIETNEVVILKRGEKGFWKTDWGPMKDYDTALSVAMTKNDMMGISPEQHDAMVCGSTRGSYGRYYNPEQDYDKRLDLLGKLPVYDDFEENNVIESLEGVGLYLYTGDGYKEIYDQLNASQKAKIDARIAEDQDKFDPPISGANDLKSHHIIFDTAEDPGEEIYICDDPKEAAGCIENISYYCYIERDDHDHAKGKYIDRRFDFSGVTKNFGMDDTAATERAYKVAYSVMDDIFAEMQDLMLGRLENAYKRGDHEAAREAFLKYYAAVDPVPSEYEAFVASVAEAANIPPGYLLAIDMAGQNIGEESEMGGIELK